MHLLLKIHKLDRHVTFLFKMAEATTKYAIIYVSACQFLTINSFHSAMPLDGMTLQAL